MSNKQSIVPKEVDNYKLIENNENKIKNNPVKLEQKQDNIIENIKEDEDLKNRTIDIDEHNNDNYVKIYEELLLKYENMNNKIIIFIKLMKKYSQIFSKISNDILSNKNIKNAKNKNKHNKAKKELKKAVKQFNKLVFSPKLNESIFQSGDNDNNILEEEDNNYSINDINENDTEEDEDDENYNSFEEKKEDNKIDINNLIEKYESKINMLLSENEILKMSKDNQNTLKNDLINKNNDLEKENNILKKTTNENNLKYDNLLVKYNDLKNKMIRIENDNSILIKENQDLKNDLINQKNEINPNEDINLLKNELSYKNSVIKYLEEILCNNKKDGEGTPGQGLGELFSSQEFEKSIKKIKGTSDIDYYDIIKNNLSISQNDKINKNIKEEINENKEMNNNKNNINITNNIDNNKRRLKLNDHLLIRNSESNEDFENKEVDFEYSNDNLNNQLDNIILPKENKKEKNIDKKNKNDIKNLTKSQKIKNDIENLDEEILEIQTKLKEMLQK